MAGAFTLIDLEHDGRRNSVAAYVLETEHGAAVVDPGPTSTLPKLREGLAALGYAIKDVSALLLTHVHLDHAGAAGTLVRENPTLRVYVHLSGAPHVTDPSKLVASATRLYGERMEPLWGEVAPVPPGQVTALMGDERLMVGSRPLYVAYTPGHAQHHVTYFDPRAGVAFVGDTAGIRGPDFPVVLPVTPPPEFDLEAWLESIDRILGFEPVLLVLSHFGPSPDPRGHLEALRHGLRDWAGFAREALRTGGTDEEQLEAFTRSLGEWMEYRVPTAAARHFLGGPGPDSCWRGLARYWRRRGV